MSSILDNLLRDLPDGRVDRVLIGLHWTAVVAEISDQQSCGLASTLSKQHPHDGGRDLPFAGDLENLSGLELASLVKSGEPALASIGMAAINALLPQHSTAWSDLKAEKVLAEQGAGRKVALIGHFPFVDNLRQYVGELTILERNPQPGDLPAEAAVDVLPQAEVVAISGTTMINHTLSELMALCSPEALIVILGPSTPLSPVLFDYGADILCGSVVTDIQPVLRTVEQGGGFRQVHRAGVRTVTMVKPGYDEGKRSVGRSTAADHTGQRGESL